MRNYTHIKGGLSKIEFDAETGEFVSTLSPEMLPQESAASVTAEIIRMPDIQEPSAGASTASDRKVG